MSESSAIERSRPQSRGAARYALQSDYNAEKREMDKQIAAWKEEQAQWEQDLANQKGNQSLWGKITGAIATAACTYATAGGAIVQCVALGSAVSGGARGLTDLFGKDSVDEGIDALEFEGDFKFGQGTMNAIEDETQTAADNMDLMTSFGSEFKDQATGVMGDASTFAALAWGIKSTLPKP